MPKPGRQVARIFALSAVAVVRTLGRPARGFNQIRYELGRPRFAVGEGSRFGLAKLGSYDSERRARVRLRGLALVVVVLMSGSTLPGFAAPTCQKGSGGLGPDPSAALSPLTPRFFDSFPLDGGEFVASRNPMSVTFDGLLDRTRSKVRLTDGAGDAVAGGASFSQPLVGQGRPQTTLRFNPMEALESAGNPYVLEVTPSGVDGTRCHVAIHFRVAPFELRVLSEPTTVSCDPSTATISGSIIDLDAPLHTYELTIKASDGLYSVTSSQSVAPREGQSPSWLDWTVQLNLGNLQDGSLNFEFSANRDDGTAVTKSVLGLKDSSGPTVTDSTPRADEIAPPPSEVSLTFNEEPRSWTLQLRNKNRTRVAGSSSQEGNSLVFRPEKTLSAAGSPYSASWTAWDQFGNPCDGPASGVVTFSVMSS